MSVLDAAIIAGLAAVFLATAVPLVRGAILRQHAAECARKLIQAAEAFDLYAAAFGSYPQSQQASPETEVAMQSVFAASDITWWDHPTELGGYWNWFYEGKAASIMISGAGLSEKRMSMLDTLLDDGDLESGLFQRRGICYHYTVKSPVVQTRNQAKVTGSIF